MSKKLRVLSLQITPLYVWDHGKKVGLESGPQSQPVIIPLKDMKEWLASLPGMVTDVEVQLLAAEQPEVKD